MSKKIRKIAKIIMIFAIMVSTFYTLSNANFGTFSANTSDLGAGATLLNNGAGTVISIIRIIGVGVALIVILVLAMKYMIAAPSDRADVKKSAIPYLIGAVIFFGASQFLSLLFDLSTKISGSGT